MDDLGSVEDYHAVLVRGINCRWIRRKPQGSVNTFEDFRRHPARFCPNPFGAGRKTARASSVVLEYASMSCVLFPSSVGFSTSARPRAHSQQTLEPEHFAAQYFDGKTAQPWDVDLEFGPRALIIFDDDGRQLASWPLRHVRRADPIGKAYPVRLRCRLDANARLVIRDDGAVDYLRTRLPRLFHNRHAKGGWARIGSILGLVTAITVISLYVSIPRLAKPIAKAIPPEWEMQLGSNTANTLSQDWTFCEGPGLAPLNQLTSLLAYSTEAKYDITVRVIDADVINAFALPGGSIIVTDELIKFTQTPDELAGVVAHEIGHILLGHPLEGMLSQMGVVLFLNMLTAGGSTDILGLGATVAMVSYTREFERAADEFGLQLLQQANISTSGYAKLFTRINDLEQVTPGDAVFGLDDLLRTHPYSDDRASLAKTIESDTPSSDIWAMPETAWFEIKTICMGEGEAQTDSQEPLNQRVDRPQKE